MPSQSPAKSQATISAFFSPSKKRTVPSAIGSNSPTIDLTTNSDEEATPPARKRMRIEPTTTSPFFSLSSSRSTASSRALPPKPSQRWILGAQNDDEILPSIEENTRCKRHEAFKRIMLGPNNPFARSKNLADASSVEELVVLEREQAILEERSEEEVMVFPKKKATKEVAREREEEEGEESDTEFRSLISGFASKTKGKAKESLLNKRKVAATVDTVGASKRKRIDEVGPSGEKWTALELQVGILPPN
jgi:DNA mismatch repair protein MSH3